MIEIFCDGSVDPKTKIGFGAFFIYNEEFEKQKTDVKKFINTSSTRLELEVLLWVLKSLTNGDEKIVVYTDCQNILSLLSRKERLCISNYMTKSGKKIKNSDLYREFFKYTSELNIEFIKVKGHKKNSQKDDIDRLFNLVDKASRRALREFNKKEEL